MVRALLRGFSAASFPPLRSFPDVICDTPSLPGNRGVPDLSGPPEFGPFTDKRSKRLHGFRARVVRYCYIKSGAGSAPRRVHKSVNVRDCRGSR